MHKTLVALASLALLSTACGPMTQTWGPSYDPGVDSTARLSGTVKDVEFDHDAELWVNTWDGWIDLSATSDYDANNTMGMMFLMGQGDMEEVFRPGHRSMDTFEVLLCGEAHGEYYDEPADDVVIDVEEEEDGDRRVLLRGTTADGRRFQEMRFVLDGQTMAPQ